MTVKQLTKFIKSHMPSEQELLRRARIAKLPEQHVCGERLEDYISRYAVIPSPDLTLLIKRINGITTVQQFASGGGPSRKIKESLRKIVQRHLQRELRRIGVASRSYRI